MGLRALIRAKKRSRHVPGVSDAHVPNVLQRDFNATAPNQKWATDVTEFKVNGRKLYLSACMDLYNGEIVAYRMARRPVLTVQLLGVSSNPGRFRAPNEGPCGDFWRQNWTCRLRPGHIRWHVPAATAMLSSHPFCELITGLSQLVAVHALELGH